MTEVPTVLLDIADGSLRGSARFVVTGGQGASRPHPALLELIQLSVPRL